MNENEKNMEVLKLLNPDYIPEKSFDRYFRRESYMSFYIKFALIAATVICAVLVFKPDPVQDDLVVKPQSQNTQEALVSTMNPNIFWNTKKLKISLDNGE